MTVPNDSNTYLPGTIQIPSSFVVTAISNSNPMVITFTVNDLSESFSYIAGQVVRLFVPITYGMFQADGLEGEILSVDEENSQITVDIDSRLFDTFSVPGVGTFQPASFAPAGARNLEFSNSTNQVPFQSLNNIGN